MRQSPAWPMVEAVAPTLAYDNAIMGDGIVPATQFALIRVPTLIMDGGESPEFMHKAANTIASVLPNAQRRTLEGQTHAVDPEVLVSVLDAFFSS